MPPTLMVAARRSSSRLRGSAADRAAGDRATGNRANSGLRGPRPWRAPPPPCFRSSPGGSRAEPSVARRDPSSRRAGLRAGRDAQLLRHALGQLDEVRRRAWRPRQVVGDVTVGADAEDREVEAPRRRQREVVAPALRFRVGFRVGDVQRDRSRPMRSKACLSMNARNVAGWLRGSTSSSRLNARAVPRSSWRRAWRRASSA